MLYFLEKQLTTIEAELRICECEHLPHFLIIFHAAKKHRVECVTEVSIALLLNFIDISFLPRAENAQR